MRFLWLFLPAFLASLPAHAGSMLPPVQSGSIVRATNGNVRLEYDLSSGRANFFWCDALKIAGFYSGVGLESYVTGTVYDQRTWTSEGNQLIVTLTKAGLPLMKQVFILDQENSFLTRVELHGSELKSRWMGPLVVDTPGGVDIGSANDNRALIVPFDNDSWTFAYNAMPINNVGSSYEVSAFYDNETRHGLVVGSVTHDQWKTGVYFEGSNHRLSVLNVYGGVTSTDTRDVLPHGEVKGNVIVSPTVFVGFGTDWRAVMEAYADANTRITPKMEWSGGVPFGWNSWYAYTTGLTYSKAIAASTFIKENLQTNHFNNAGVVYVNLDSYWSNLTDAELRQFVEQCRANRQKAGIYWTPFVYWGTASQGSNSWMTGATYRWSDAYLRTPEGSVQTIDGGIAIDPTHPGTRQMISYYINYFKSRGFEYLKLDFLSHGALEGVHYDANVTTGIQAYNQGMSRLVAQNDGAMFLNESIAPIFPYHYAHSRRIACDTSTTISETAFQMQSVSYGWWLSGRLYQYSDPDVMKFAGGTANESQSRLISCAISGTVFLNGDDLASSEGQSLARTHLTNPRINEVARAGKSFRPVEGNTGTSATDVFVRQDGSTWYVAVFNYRNWSANKTLNLARLGLQGDFTAMDLWSGAISSVSGGTWNISLGARQAKLFRLGTGAPTLSGLADKTVFPGEVATFRIEASGAPPFSYQWRKDGEPVGQNANQLIISPVQWGDRGTYTVEVSGGGGQVTNSALLHVSEGLLSWSAGNGVWDLNGAGWKDPGGVDAVYRDGAAVVLDDSASGITPIRLNLGRSLAPDSITISNSGKDYILAGGGNIYGSTPMIKSGTGRAVLATDNSYTGSTLIRQGALQIGEGGTRGRLGSGMLTNYAKLVFDCAGLYAFPVLASTYPAILGGPGTVKQIGAGKLVFNYQYVFGTWLGEPEQGLYVGPGSTAETTAYNPVGRVTLEGGTLSSSGGNSAGYQSWVLCDGVAVLSHPCTAILTNYSGLNTFSEIELRDTTIFNIAAGATNGVDLFVPAVLTHSYWEYGDWGTLMKTGEGTMVLTAQNLYQGETIVAGGALLLKSPGSIAASGFPVTIRAGGRFGGTGLVKRNVNVQTGGVFEPGSGEDRCGQLRVSGNVSLAGTTVLRVNRLTEPGNDSLDVSGTLDFAGALVVTNTGSELEPGDTFKLFERAGTGAFASLSLPSLRAGLGWTNRLTADGTIAVVRQTSATPADLSLVTTGTNLWLTWPEDHTGWVLQVQTNAPGEGLGSAWHNVPNTTDTNVLFLPADSSSGSVFFRLLLEPEARRIVPEPF